MKSVDLDEPKVFVDLSKSRIKDSPEFDKDKHVGTPKLSDYYQNQRRT